ncbi:MAG: ChrB protein [Burkholderiales bacterium]|nr:ChrB protein [Anaerolineae bacterium]
MNTWLLLIYKVPNEPSARRVYVWRKLKGMGAILLQDSAWVLPATPRAREKLQWLATEIKDMEGGMATLWEAQEVFTGQDTPLVEQFTQQTDAVYSEILSQLSRDEPDLAALSKQYQQTKQQDYFHSELGERVREALLQRRGADDL